MASLEAVRIGNCSGFYGDRLSAMREMLTGGELDYLTGDYLAELTMLILGRGCNVERKAVRGDAARDVDSDGSDLALRPNGVAAIVANS